MEQLGQLEQPDLTAGHPPQLVVLQPTPFCNIACDYCYLPNRNDRRRMSSAVLDHVLAALGASTHVRNALTFAWHAGEPLSVGVDYLARAFARIDEWARDTARRVVHSVQTNATLIDDRWIESFRRHDVRLGLSLDGPRDIHDAHRVTRRREGTFERAIAGAQRLRDAGIPFSALAVVTADTLDHADDFFDFFVALAPTELGMNVEELEAANRRSSLHSSSADSRLRAFYRRLIERNREAGSPLRICELVPFRALLETSARLSLEHFARRSTSATPFQILSFESDGSFGTFCPELLGTDAPRFANFRFGRVPEDAIDAIVDRAEFRAALAEIEQGRERCRAECGYWRFCGGGQPANKWFETGRLDSTETAYCRHHCQRLVDAVLDEAERVRDRTGVPQPQA